MSILLRTCYALLAFLGACVVAAGCAQGVTVEDKDDSSTGPNENCAMGSTSCAGKCVKLASDPLNCGSCGHDCGASKCANGTCTAGCNGGLLECTPGSCIDGTSDPANCGACDRACLPEQMCVSSNCTCPAGAPDECPDGCKNTMTDPDNCGSCGNPCPGMFDTCVNGGCQAGCMPGETLCAGNQCANLSSDNSHCGMCNNPCPGGMTCSAFMCVCSNQQCGACSPTSLGSTVPQTVTGSTANATNNLEPICASTGGQDVAYTFTAPSSGTVVFDTVGSSFDTVLYAFDATSCSPIDCNDDFSGLQSELTLTLTSGQQIVMVLDGYDNFEYGSYVLNISP